MRNMKKVVALTLAGAMVFGSSLTAFAEDNEPVTTGSTTGAGASEGHMDTHIIEVTLPTNVANTTFAYTMDPERLIQATEGAKYDADTVFPDEDDDTGVYFLTGTSAASAAYTEVTGLTSAVEGSGVSSYKVLAEGVDELTQTNVENTDQLTSPEEEYAKDGVTYYEWDDTNEEWEVVSDLVVSVEGSDVSSYYTVKSGTDTTADGWDKVAANFEAATGKAVSGVKYYNAPVAAGTKTYANTSSVLTAISESSADVELTVSVAASSANSDITLVNAIDEDDDSAQLSLGLIVNDGTAKTTTPIEAGKTISKKVTIAGKDSNFEASVVDDDYKYVAKTGNDITWNSASFSMTGAVNEVSAEGLTAPTLTVTWKYEDPAAEEEEEEESSEPSVTNCSLEEATGDNAYVKPTNASATTTSTITISYGEYEAVSAVQFYKDETTGFKDLGATQTNAVWDNDTKTLTMKDSWLAGKTTGFQIRFVFDNDTDKNLIVTFK